MLRKFFTTAILAFLLLPLAVSGEYTLPDENGIQMLTNYFDLLTSGNFESAGYMWSGADQERSSRFGIEYTGIPVRVDCTSPIVRDIDGMRGHLNPPVKQAQELETGKYFRLDFSNLVGGRLVKYSYYTEKMGDNFWLIYPQDFYGKDWPVEETKYFRIHVSPERKPFLNAVLTDEADRSVEQLADSLGLTKADLQEIELKKIEYFYCPSDSSVLQITGASTKGMFDEASNDIISSEFPHTHELVHLLVNMKLRALPIATLPILREGLAVRYGGRWGKRASALMDLGSFLIREKVIEIDSILTSKGFQSNDGSDIAYPVAGVFVSYLLERLGPDKFYQLYLSLSADPVVLDTMNHVQLKLAFSQALGKPDWQAVMSDFDTYISHTLPSFGVALPGLPGSCKTIIKDSLVVVSQDKNWLAFEFHSDTSKPPQGNFLFGTDPKLQGHQSFLFAEQYGNQVPYQGYRYGVRFDSNEVGLYDYGTNELVAKYIWGITPSDKYYDSTAQVVRIRFKRSALHDVVMKDNDYRMLPM
jgi:hypothetical protein